jgi:molecular chaperone DnaJ
MKDPYSVLGVAKNATKEEIVKAYRKGAQTHHPDRNPGDSEAEARFREIQEAYDILSDDSKRSQYDSNGFSMHFRNRGSEGNPFGPDFGDVMNEIFGKSTFRGRNMTVRLEIDLEEAYSGCTKEISLKLKNTCNTCKGLGQLSSEVCGSCQGQGFTKVNNAPFEFRTNCQVCNGLGKINPIPCDDCNANGFLAGHKEKKIQIQIPCGIDDAMNLKLVGEGEESVRGGRPGDLIVHILVREHAIFTRDGIDLLIDVPMTYSQLVFGCDIDVVTIGKEVVTVKIPEGTQSHAKFKIRGKGMIMPNGVYGDLFITVKIEIPKNISLDYKENIKKLMPFEMNNLGFKREQWLKNVNKNSK